MKFEVNTEDKMAYKIFSTDSQALKIHVKTSHDAHIALTSGPDMDHPMYEILLGTWDNTKICIRKNQEVPNVAQLAKNGLLSKDRFVSFVLTFFNKQICIGLIQEKKTKEGTSKPELQTLLSWPDPHLFQITHFGVRTCWGATGTWKIEDTLVELSSKPVGSNVVSPIPNKIIWIPASKGSIPPNALQGGLDPAPLFIGRALHTGSAIIPGKVKDKGACIIACGGIEHSKNEYEVLIGCDGIWLKTNGDNIPHSAIRAGKSEDGETLYIGRAEHDSILTIGKVLKSSGKCYITVSKKEIAKEEFELLVLPMST